MNLFEAMLLGIFQGITEFLPISSSGHLILAEHFLSLPANDLLAFDAVLHGGSLVSLIAVFHKEVLGFFRIIFFPKYANKKEKDLFLWLIIATIPTIVVGFLWQEQMEIFRTPYFVAIFFLISAFFFILAEQFPKKKKSIFQKQSVWFCAIFQVFALLPGISRSGIVTAAGMLSGSCRKESTRFAFLMGLPVIAGAFSLSILQIFSGEIFYSPTIWTTMVGFLASAISGFFMARFLLQFFQEHSLYSFSIYLIIVACITFFTTV